MKKLICHPWSKGPKVVASLKTVAILTLCFAALLSSCTSLEKEKLGHVTRGKEYLSEKRYAEARIEFRSALKIDKKMADAQFGLGEASLALGYVQEAAEAYYEAMRIDPNNLDARVRVGSLLAQYESDEGIKEAERLAMEVTQKNPNHIEGHVLTAEVRAAQKRWNDAQAEFQKAISLDPTRVETYLHQARYYERRAKADAAGAQGFHSQGEQVFRQLIEKNPNTVGVRLAYGDFLFAGKREAEAEQQLLQAHKTDPKDKLVL